MKTYGRMEVSFHSFLTSTLDDGDWSVYSPEQSTRHPLMSKLGGCQSRSRRDGKEANLLLPRKENFAIPLPSPAAIMSKSSGSSNQWNSPWLLSHKRLDELQNPSCLRKKKKKSVPVRDQTPAIEPIAQHITKWIPRLLAFCSSNPQLPPGTRLGGPQSQPVVGGGKNL